MRWALLFSSLALCCQAQFLSVQIGSASRMNAGSATSVNNGLVLWLKLDEGSGTQVADSSGNNRGGYWTNNVFWTNGYSGNGLRFDGDMDTGGLIGTVIVTNTSTLNLTTFSVAFWVREINTTFHGYLVSKFRESDGNFGWQVMSESGQLRYGEWDTVNWIETPDTNPDSYITDGQWHHFVATRDGTSTFNTTTNALSYKDGVRISGNLIFSGGTVSSISNDGPIKLGYNTEYDGKTPDVVLDDVRIYNRVLTSNEIWGLSHP